MPKGVEVSCLIGDPSKYALTIQIDGDLPRAMNKVMRSHWGKNHKETDRWKTLVQNATHPFRPTEPLKKVQIVAIRYNYRMLDYDGLVASLKPLIDGLKGTIIQDDNWAVTGPWVVGQEFRPKAKGPRLSIRITELTEPVSKNSIGLSDK